MACFLTAVDWPVCVAGGRGPIRAVCKQCARGAGYAITSCLDVLAQFYGGNELSYEGRHRSIGLRVVRVDRLPAIVVTSYSLVLENSHPVYERKKYQMSSTFIINILYFHPAAKALTSSIRAPTQLMMFPHERAESYGNKRELMDPDALHMAALGYGADFLKQVSWFSNG